MRWAIRDWRRGLVLHRPSQPSCVATTCRFFFQLNPNRLRRTDAALVAGGCPRSLLPPGPVSEEPGEQAPAPVHCQLPLLPAELRGGGGERDVGSRQRPAGVHVCESTVAGASAGRAALPCCCTIDGRECSRATKALRDWLVFGGCAASRACLDVIISRSLCCCLPSRTASCSTSPTSKATRTS